MSAHSPSDSPDRTAMLDAAIVKMEHARVALDAAIVDMESARVDARRQLAIARGRDLL